MAIRQATFEVPTSRTQSVALLRADKGLRRGVKLLRAVVMPRFPFGLAFFDLASIRAAAASEEAARSDAAREAQIDGDDL